MEIDYEKLFEKIKKSNKPEVKELSFVELNNNKNIDFRFKELWSEV